MKLTNIAEKMHSFEHFSEGADRPAGHNRRIKHRLDGQGRQQIVYTLHNKEIAVMTRDAAGTQELTLDYCGWHTRTTAKAMGEFIDRVWIAGVSASASLVRVLGNNLRDVNCITIQLTRGLMPEPRFTDAHIKDGMLHYRLYGFMVDPLPVVDGYIVAPPYVGLPKMPQGATDLTKGFAVFPESRGMTKVLRARKPEVRSARLMAAVLLGEAQLHAW